MDNLVKDGVIIIRQIAGTVFKLSRFPVVACNAADIASVTCCHPVVDTVYNCSGNVVLTVAAVFAYNAAHIAVADHIAGIDCHGHSVHSHNSLTGIIG